MLRDLDIQSLLEGPSPVVTNIRNPGGPFTGDSPIQPASLDLTIGKVFLPERRERERGSLSYPIEEYSLGPGETAVVHTEQEMRLPDDLAGIAFPPDSVSKKALLITNPGHIDPGYHGPLKFTIINMGQEPFDLKRGDAIATLLLFKLAGPCQSGWLTRHGNQPGAGVTDPMLGRLSKDFVNVGQRAERVAREQVRKAELIGALVLFLVTIITIVGAFIPTYLVEVRRANDAPQRVAVVEQRLQAIEHAVGIPGPSPTPSSAISQIPTPQSP